MRSSFCIIQAHVTNSMHKHAPQQAEAPEIATFSSGSRLASALCDRHSSGVLRHVEVGRRCRQGCRKQRRGRGHCVGRRLARMSGEHRYRRGVRRRSERRMLHSAEHLPAGRVSRLVLRELPVPCWALDVRVLGVFWSLPRRDRRGRRLATGNDYVKGRGHDRAERDRWSRHGLGIPSGWIISGPRSTRSS